MTIEPFLGTRAQRAFLGTILFQVVVVIAMVSLVFNWVANWVSFNNGSLYKTIPCYLALFILAAFFELAMAWDALRARNIIQVLGILIYHSGVIIFSAIQVHETRKALGTSGDCGYDGTRSSYISCWGKGTLFAKVEPPLIVAPCVGAVTWISMIWWAKQLYAEFGWAIFHKVGANPTMKNMYRSYQIFICLLKFDFFFFSGVTIQLLIIVLSSNSVEFGLTVAAIPVVLILLVGAGLAVQREIRWLMWIALSLMPVAQVYFIYKLVRFFQPSSRGQYATTVVTLTVFTVSAFVILFATFCIGVRCFLDFDKGLLPSKVHDIKPNRPYSSGTQPASPTTDKPGYQGGFAMSPRISIE